MITLHSHGSEPSAPRRGVCGYVALSSAVTALGGVLFGYDTGVVSGGALLFFKDDFGGLSSFQQELVTSLLLVGAVVGALCAGRVADQVGRKKTVLVTAGIFVERVIIGVGVGSASMVAPRYIGEIVSPRFLYFWNAVPETKRRSLQQIERDFAVERGAPVGASAAGR